MTTEGDTGDLNTLRMATPEVSRVALQGYLGYQRAFLEALEKLASVQDPFGWEGRFARADQVARSQAGIDSEQVSRMRALCEDYCGRMSTAERLQEALNAGKVAADAKAQAQERIEVLCSQALLRERYGHGWMEALESLKPELLELHRRMNRRLT